MNSNKITIEKKPAPIKVRICTFTENGVEIEEYQEKRVIEKICQLVPNTPYNKISSKCFDCRFANVKECPKIAFKLEKGLDVYPYIKEAVQVICNDDSVDTFFISKCDNFKPDLPRTKEEELKAEKAINTLCDQAIDSYDCNNEVRESLIRRKAYLDKHYK